MGSEPGSEPQDTSDQGPGTAVNNPLISPPPEARRLRTTKAQKLTPEKTQTKATATVAHQQEMTLTRRENEM
jgi:hypothetical protein